MSSVPETPSSTDAQSGLLALGVAAFSPIFGSIGRAANLSQALASFETLCKASHDQCSLVLDLEADAQLNDAVWTILGGCQMLSRTLAHNPQLLDSVSNSRWLQQPRTPEQARAACRDFCFAHENRRTALQAWRERELLRIALRDLVLNAPSSESTLEIALLAGVCLSVAVDEVARLHLDADAPAFAVIGLGEFGGMEMHASSALDAAFVFDFPSSSPAKDALAAQFAQELIAYLSGEDEGANWNLNASFRPRGAMVFTIQTLDDYLHDPRSGFSVSQRQSLTRARFAAGDFALGARAMTLIRGAAHPPGWDFDWNDELLALKERAEQEHASASSDGNELFDVNGTGTLSDIEWAASWMALKYGHDAPTLQTSSTRIQLQAARGANLLAGVESGALVGAYDWFRRAQLRLQFVRDSALSGVKRDSNDFEVWARAVLPTQPKEEASVVFEETWRAHAQNVRLIFERVRDML